MKKEEIIRRCYGGMKERHGVETIILFHVGDSFERILMMPKRLPGSRKCPGSR